MRTDERTGYRTLLRDELDTRRRRNPGYSQRAFARDLGIRPNRLSEILRGKQGLSEKVGSELARRLYRSASEREYFEALVSRQHARSQAARERAEQRLERLKTEHSYRNLQRDVFAVVADWYPLAILELAKVEGAVLSPAKVAEAFHLPEALAREALERLQRIGALERRGSAWHVQHANNAVAGGVPSAAIRRFHRQLLAKASAALRRQTVEERHFSSTLLAIRRERLGELRERIEAFWRSVDTDFGVPEGGSDVYCLAVQLFNLTPRR